MKNMSEEEIESFIVGKMVEKDNIEANKITARVVSLFSVPIIFVFGLIAAIIVQTVGFLLVPLIIASGIALTIYLVVKNKVEASMNPPDQNE